MTSAKIVTITCFAVVLHRGTTAKIVTFAKNDTKSTTGFQYPSSALFVTKCSFLFLSICFQKRRALGPASGGGDGGSDGARDGGGGAGRWRRQGRRPRLARQAGRGGGGQDDAAAASSALGSASMLPLLPATLRSPAFVGWLARASWLQPQS